MRASDDAAEEVPTARRGEPDTLLERMHLRELVSDIFVLTKDIAILTFRNYPVYTVGISSLIIYIHFLLSQYITLREYFIYLLGLSFLSLLIKKFINILTQRDKKIFLAGIILWLTTIILALTATYITDVNESFFSEYTVIAEGLTLLAVIFYLISLIIFWYFILKYFLRTIIAIISGII